MCIRDRPGATPKTKRRYKITLAFIFKTLFFVKKLYAKRAKLMSANVIIIGCTE